VISFTDLRTSRWLTPTRALRGALAAGFACASMRGAEERSLGAFDGPTFAPWSVTGTAFGRGPVNGAADSAPAGVKDLPLRGALESPEFTLDRDYLNFRVAGGDRAFRSAVSLWVDDRVVRTTTGGGRDDLAWATWDVRGLRGKRAWVGVYDQCIEDERGYVRADDFSLSDEARTRPGGVVADAETAVRRQAVESIRRNAARAATDPWRPTYHYAPPAQRMNDPNGPAWHDGWHHVFYQHMVFEGSGPAIDVHWGHARSRDLVNWETLPLAVTPDYARGEHSCFSGNLAWDGAGEPVQWVTRVPYRRGARREIRAMRPADREWVRWERVADGPPRGLVPVGDPARDLKDAFPFAVGARRFLVLTDRNIPIYEARDAKLTHWEHRGVLDPESAECPNFFEVDGRWVYLASPHQPVRYRIGSFDAATAAFAPRTEGRINHDPGFYASTAYRDDLGRTVLLGVSRGQKSSPAWTGVLALPRLLTIGPDDRPRMQPAPALEQLRRKPFRLDGTRVLRDHAEVVAGLTGDSLEIVARFRVDDASACGLRVRRSADGKRALPVMWRQGRIVAVKETAAYPCAYDLGADREVTLRLFLDKGLLDVVTSDGRVFESRVHQAPLADLGVEVFAAGGAATVLSLEAWEMAPARIDHRRLLEGGAL
jgi:sucrose-6-phosphate hydrolase SacC (GH32 family)